MNRRDFIVSAIGAATMAAVPENDGVVLESMAHPGSEFGLAPIKAEGSMVAFDPTPCDVPKGVLTHARVQTMRLFGLDPTNEEHVEAYLETVDVDPANLEELEVWIDEQA